MLERNFPTFWKERKRLAFVAVLAFLAGFLFYARVDAYVFGVQVGVATGLIYAAVIAPVALIICLFLPRMRFLIEAIAVSRLLVALFVFAFPAIGQELLLQPILMAILVVSLGAVLSRTVLHGKIVRFRARTWRTALRPRHHLRRRPVRLQSATDWQRRFVGWVDDTAPITA